MAYWQTTVMVLIGVALSCFPSSRSHQHAHEAGWTSLLVIYGAPILLVAIAAVDTAQWLPYRPLVDVILFVGGLALGAIADRVIRGLPAAGTPLADQVALTRTGRNRIGRRP